MFSPKKMVIITLAAGALAASALITSALITEGQQPDTRPAVGVTTAMLSLTPSTSEPVPSPAPIAEPSWDNGVVPSSVIQAPTSVAEPSGFLCKDGTVSHAQHRQGACSHHGGVA